MTTSAREPLLENMRGVLITLVVMGHALEPFLDREPLARALYTAIYLFHIPAFAFLSGHLTRAEWSRKALTHIAWSLLAPFLIFQVLYVAFDVWVLDHGWSDEWWVRPYWLLWFLWSLACWRLLLPLVRRVPMPWAVSVFIALGAGLIPGVGYTFGLSRTLVFLPCFVAGHRVRREWLLKNTARHRGVAALLFIGMGIFVGLIATGQVTAPNTQWLYGSASYSALGATPIIGMATRLALLGCALAFTWAVLMLCPRNTGILTGLGGRSLAPFLLHGFVVRGVEKAGGFALLQGIAGILLALAGGAMLALLLAHPRIVALTRPLWEPRKLFGRA